MVKKAAAAYETEEADRYVGTRGVVPPVAIYRIQGSQSVQGAIRQRIRFHERHRKRIHASTEKVLFSYTDFVVD